MSKNIALLLGVLILSQAPLAYTLYNRSVNEQKLEEFLIANGCIPLGPPTAPEAAKYLKSGYQCGLSIVAIPK